MLNNFVLFLVILFLQSLADRSNIYECKDHSGKLLIMIHHSMNIYAFFGSLLFGFHSVHICILIGALFIHILFGRCPLTTLNNEICLFDKNQPLQTFLNNVIQTSNMTIIKQCYYILLILVIMYDITKVTFS